MKSMRVYLSIDVKISTPAIGRMELSEALDMVFGKINDLG